MPEGASELRPPPKKGTHKSAYRSQSTQIKDVWKGASNSAGFQKKHDAPSGDTEPIGVDVFVPIVRDGKIAGLESDCSGTPRACEPFAAGVRQFASVGKYNFQWRNLFLLKSQKNAVAGAAN